ncbi:MAG: sigma-70 family RNA polymerase sigma factor [Verrucomicrobia bacterium]|nr:sigma-70 family RNA polymerase sigma factor [Verrucomicrobiota bacterium]
MDERSQQSTADTPQARALADRQTVERVLAGDTEAFAELLQRHQSAVYTHLWRMVRRPEDAMDLAQETFVKAFKYLAHYNPRWAFKTWLMTIATNTAINFIQKRRLQTVSLEEVAEPVVEPARHDAKDLKPALLAALARLPEKARAMFNLRYQEELSLAEIGAVLGESLANVKVTLHRARRFLKAELEQEL